MSNYFRLKNPDDVTESQALAATWSGPKDGMDYLLYFAYIHGANSRWEDMKHLTNLPRIIEGKLARKDDAVESAAIYGYYVDGEFQQGTPEGVVLGAVDELGNYHIDFPSSLDGIVVHISRKPCAIRDREHWVEVSPGSYQHRDGYGPIITVVE